LEGWHGRSTTYPPDLDEGAEFKVESMVVEGQNLEDRWNRPRTEFGPLYLSQGSVPNYVIKYKNHPDTPAGPLTFGEKVALALRIYADPEDVWIWVYYSSNHRQIFASFGPQYDWEITGGQTGTIVRPRQGSSDSPYHIVGIYNAVRQDHLIACAGNDAQLGWAGACEQPL
jgi:hypothetical protein